MSHWLGSAASYAEASELASTNGAAIQMQGDVAAQLDGARHPRTGRNLDRAAACRGHSFNGLIDGLAILCLAIALRAERRDIGCGCGVPKFPPPASPMT